MSRPQTTLWNVLVLMRVPLIVTTVLAVVLLDLASEGSMREAMRYAVFDRPQHLAAIALALLLVTIAVRFTGEAMVQLVAPELLEAGGVIAKATSLTPKLCAAALGLAVALPMLTLGEWNALIAGLAYVAVGLVVAFIPGPFPGPRTIGDIRPGDPLRLALGVPPFLIALILCFVTVGLFQSMTAKDALVNYGDGGFLRIAAEALAVFALCTGTRAAFEIFATAALTPLHGGWPRPFFSAVGRLVAFATGMAVALALFSLLPTTYFSPRPIGLDPAYNPLVTAILAMALVAVVAAFGDIVWTTGPTLANAIAENWHRTLFLLSAVPLRGRLVLAGLFALAVFVTLKLADLTQPDAAQSVGTTALILGWGCAACGLFFPIALLSHFTRVPMLVGLLAAGVAFSAFDLNDNHTVRQTHDTFDNPGAETYFGERLDLPKWLASRTDVADYPHYPVFLVATEGGGIRAAYFTASVLAALQERCPGLAQHTLAISSVSGGSVGAAVYAGLASEYAQNARHRGCNPPTATTGPFLTATRHVLGSDFLAPLVGATLFPDALARISPKPVGNFDRARALEYALERAWDEAVPQDPVMSSSIRSLYAKRGAVRPPIPHLFLNTTHVETGASVPYPTATLCDADTASSSGAAGIGMMDCSEGLEQGSARVFFQHRLAGRIEDAVLPLSVAAVLSARFPYLTPAARILYKGRYVDGGYFENSGAWYAGVVAQHLLDQKMQAPGSAAAKSQIVLLVIRSTPHTSLPGAEPPVQGLNEVLSPLRTLLNTRSARADYSRRDVTRLFKLVERLQCPPTTAPGPRPPTEPCASGLRLVELSIPPDAALDVPLTWTLSRASRKELDDIVNDMRTARGDGATGFDAVVCLLDSTRCGEAPTN